ncbi:MAG: phosphotransferase [Deltaproteobacteria bacterium]|nr:phosphotransferase [Deltaproteobacteria bacterium]
MVVRRGLEGYLDLEALISQRETAQPASPFHGRSRLSFLRLGNGETALARAYHHGGVLRHLTGDLFFTWPPRPFRELAITEEARHRGVSTVEVLGAGVQRLWGPLYQGWLFTRELTGARDLWAAVQSGFALPAMDPVLKAVAQSVCAMHRKGIYHRDLNLKNILVRWEEDRIRSYLIDFDKARLFPGEIPASKARHNLRRLQRSAHKLDPESRFFGPSEWDRFFRFYQEARGDED